MVLGGLRAPFRTRVRLKFSQDNFEMDDVRRAPARLQTLFGQPSLGHFGAHSGPALERNSFGLLPGHFPMSCNRLDWCYLLAGVEKIPGGVEKICGAKKSRPGVEKTIPPGSCTNIPGVKKNRTVV